MNASKTSSIRIGGGVEKPVKSYQDDNYKYLLVKSSCSTQTQTETETETTVNTEKDNIIKSAKALEMLFPNYYNREHSKFSGVGTKWHYAGHFTDVLRVVCAFYGLLIRHPCIAFRGMSWSLKELFDRLAILSPRKKMILKKMTLPLSFLVPIVGIPVFFMLAILPVSRKSSLDVCLISRRETTQNSSLSSTI
jgi:hypothetical protein